MFKRNRELEAEETWWENLIAFLGSLSVIGIIILTLWYWIDQRISSIYSTPAEGSTQETGAVSGDVGTSNDIETKWNRLIAKYPSNQKKIQVKEESADSFLITTDEEEPEEESREETGIQEVVKAFIRYANPKLSDSQARSTASHLIKWAEHYKLPVGLVVGVAHAESNFKIRAEGILVKGDRATGIMQVMWPMHQKLARHLGVKNKQDMFGELGVKVGCYLLKTYIRDEQSIIGGLKRYLSSLSKVYILEKVLTDWMVIEQAVTGTISIEEIRDSHQTERNYMKKLTGRR